MWLVEPRLLAATAIATTAVCAAALFARLVRGRASVRHLVWQGALVTSVVSALAAASPLRPSMAIPLPRLMASRTTASPAQPPSGDARTSAPTGRNGARIVELLWLAGFLGVAVRYGRALSCASALRRRASAAGERWERHVAAARARIGYRGPLDVLVSREIDVPVVTGLRHPALLLPVAASEWSDREADLVFLHELAHVERGDHLARAVGALAVALHWFNPLIWWLNEKATTESELAADEAVLGSGVRSTDYAEMLISVAERTVWRPATIPGVALVGRPMLSTRVHAILAMPRPRSAIGRTQRRVAIAAAAIVAATMGGARVRLVDARQPTSRPAAPSQRVSHADTATARTASPPVTTPRVERERVARTVRSVAPRTNFTSEPDDGWTARAVAGLTELLDDPSPQVRDAAARSLSRLGARR